MSMTVKHLFWFTLSLWLSVILICGDYQQSLKVPFFQCNQSNFVHCGQCSFTVVSCTNSDINQVPIFSPFLEQLNLSQNVVPQLNEKVFRHLSQLHTLDLSSNRIETLPNLVFSGLGNLRQLFLSDNRIGHINKNAFKNLHELKQLHLEGNPLKRLDGDVFYDLPSLEQLSFFIWPSKLAIDRSIDDDRSILCNCVQIRQRWNLLKQFAFCKNLNIVSYVNNHTCAHVVAQMDSVISFESNAKSKPMISKSKPNNEYTSNTSLLTNTTNKLEIANAISPIFSLVPDSLVRVRPGHWLQWKCAANGNPQPTYRWLKGDQLLSENDTLTLGEAKLEHEGTYECVANNKVGVAAKEVKLYIIGIITNQTNIILQNTSFPITIARHPFKPNEISSESRSNVSLFLKRVKWLMRQSDGGITFNSVETLTKVDALSPVQQMVLQNYTGCVGGSRLEVLQCQLYTRYRSITGLCNNLLNPLWGSQMIPFLRLLPAQYQDNLAKPVAWFATSTNEHRKPNPRKVTKQLLSTGHVLPDPKHNHMLMQFGQFLDHDITFTVPSQTWNILEDDRLDCRKTCHYVDPCFSVNINTESSVNNNNSERCIEVVRSAEFCGTGFTSAIFGKLIAREQANQLTSFIDGSNIYGSNVELSRILRDLNRDQGLLKHSIVGNRKYLPLSDEHFPIDCQLVPTSPLMECFLAGDHRANEHIGLLMFHNIWLRHHNHLAKELKKLHSEWSAEQVYQEARKIVGAQLQIITYQHWLPAIIGAEGMQMLGTYQGYNSTVNPSVSNVFATAAMRFGHTLVNSHLIRKLVANNNRSSDGDMKLRRLFFASHLLYQEGMLDSILKGLLEMPLKLPQPEQAISNELTEHLFEQSRQVPLDLASINIQRGRDHALADYNQWRAWCGLTRANTFEDLQTEIKNAKIRAKLRTLYDHPDDIDLWVGGIMEQPNLDAKVGPTFRCLLVDQFKRLRDGDRYYFENKGVFTQAQLNELKHKTSLSKILCTNGDNFKKVPMNTFELTKKLNWIDCDSLPNLDLSKW